MHRRMRSHRAGLTAKTQEGHQVLRKHQVEVHSQSEPSYRMEKVKGARSVLERIVKEGTLIKEQEEKESGVLMNSKGEYGRGKMIRFVVDMTKY